MLDSNDTIVAIASPMSPAVRGIVRMSGPIVVCVLEDVGICCPRQPRPSRFDSHIDLGDPLGQIAISVMLWPTHRSYTGQPSAELHVYGSLPILSKLSQTLIEASRESTGSRVRIAQPGEFTMRAFLAGRLDLTQAEAVLGVIEAQGRGSLDHSLRQLAGNLSKPLEQMRSTLLDLLADVEAGLDFVDEDIDFISDETLIDRLSGLSQTLRQTARTLQVRGGGGSRTMIALRGEPNAGKSCLINRLAGKSVAIVTEIAGTTRDTVSVTTRLGEHSVTLVDTAGIEQSIDEITNQSQLQAVRASTEADIRLWCVDGTRPDFPDAAARLRSEAARDGRRSAIDLWLATKSDLASTFSGASDWIPCSAVSGEGIDRVCQFVDDAINARDAMEVGSTVGTAARCQQSLKNALDAIENSILYTQNQTGHEFVAADLRLAAQSLGEVTGAVYTDDILDRVFGRFCIGK